MSGYNTCQIATTALIFFVGAALTSCSTIEQTSDVDNSSAESEEIDLPAVEKPQDRVAGTKYVWITDGETTNMKIIEVDDGVITASLENGCQWKVDGWSYAPVLEWTKCNGSSAYRKIRKSKGTPWPMQVGNRWSYSYTHVPETGNTARRTYRCNVETAENLVVPAGEFQAFKIVCKDRSVTNTYWHTSQHAAGLVKHISKTAKTTSISELVELIAVQ